MEIKKAPQKDLERKKAIFLQIGLIITLSLVLIAFEWSSSDVRVDFLPGIEDDGIIEEVVPITVHKEKLEMPKPVFDVLIITDSDDFPEPDLFIPDTEDTNIDLTNYTIKVEEEKREDIFVNVEEMPEFPGGNNGLLKYLASSVKYPEIARINNVQGKVYVSFVINKKGEVTHVAIARGVDSNLDREALRVVNSMPLWKPGRQNNENVNVSYTVPINFVLKQN